MMKVPFVDLKIQYQSIKEKIDHAISSVVNDTAFIGGKYVKQFEDDFCSFTNSTYTIGVGNGTDALTIALRALDLEPGFEVILPANSFIATAEAVTNAGGKVIFCDIEPESYLLNLNTAHEKITRNTKAIIPVHLYGQMMDMVELKKFADSYNLFIIEDAAQAHGAKYNNITIGQLSNLACYSFYPGKNLGAYGDGGAITTNNEELALRIRKFSDHGSIKKYMHEYVGFNSRLDGIQAAILSVKLKYLLNWTINRQNAANYYNNQLEPFGLPVPKTNVKSRHVYHLYVTIVENRDYVLSELHKKGVGAGIHYPFAIPFLPAYNYLNHTPADFPIAASQMHKLLTLPLFPEITQEQIDYVINSIKDILG